ncbi:MAG: hypothetical protein R3B81_06195 [bacterium]
MRMILTNLPGLLGLLLAISFSADIAPLRPLKTEQTFGLWLVVLVPLAIVLLATQLILWWRLPRTRPWRRNDSGDRSP